MSTTEPSTFALDVYFAAGAQGDEKLAEHVASCERCTAYLAQLAEAAPLQLPATPLVRRRRASRKLVAAGAFVSACAAVLLYLNVGERYVGSKGLPAVQALIRRADRASVWDGKMPLRVGDAIALRTDCDRFSHVAVAVADGGEKKRVFEGVCNEREPLPFTLVADDKPGSEQIHVVFSRAALAEAALHKAITSRERGETVWVITLVLPKAGAEP